MKQSPLFAAPTLVHALALALMLNACSQATSPGSTGQALAANNTANQGGATSLAAGTLIPVNIASGTALLARFPGIAKLQLSITGAAGTAGLPVQLNIPTNNLPQTLSLPTGTNLNITFDAFDAAGAYLGTGNAISVLQANVSPVIPVNLNPVAAGTAYIDPLTIANGGGGAGAGAGGGAITLTVSVDNAPSQQAISNATVVISSGLTSATTDVNGLANFTSLTLPQDVHVFSGKQALSIISFQGNSLQMNFTEFSPLTATVHVNSPTGPSLLPTWLMDIYLTDGINIYAFGGVNGDTTATRTIKLPSIRGPVAMSAFTEDTAQVTPKTDHGFLISRVTSGDSMATPLNTAITDPALEPPVVPQGDYITIASVPSGFSGIKNIRDDVFAAISGTALAPGDIYALVSHDDKQVLPNNQRNISIWPAANATSYIRRIEITDPYAAKSTAWQRVAAPALTQPLTPPSFATLPTFYGAPVITQASLIQVAWTDWNSSPVWSGYIVEFSQGIDKSWKIYNFAPSQILILPVSFANFSPLIKGLTATVTVHLFLLDPTSGFNISQPDLWYLDRYLSHKVSSQPFTFIP